MTFETLQVWSIDAGYLLSVSRLISPDEHINAALWTGERTGQDGGGRKTREVSQSDDGEKEEDRHSHHPAEPCQGVG